MQTYILATNKDWHLRKFESIRRFLPGQWTVVVSKLDLEATVVAMKPRFVFFPHWSDIVPDAVLRASECVCFHMTDVPYGRGGSPLQNLIVRGHKETKLTALRMEKELDAGPVYMKTRLSLDGSARNIFLQAAEQIMDMIRIIVHEEPTPVPQEGAPTLFTRRKPEESLIPSEASLEQIYDHIRMLDAEGYPHAFIEHGDWQVQFTDAQCNEGSLEARACFTRKES